MFSLTSPAFEHKGRIPRRHTCEGEDLSPPLDWTDPPAATRAYALVVDDPDAPGGTFTHWLAWDIGGDKSGVTESERLAREGKNDFGELGYRGPCPPRGHRRHRYVFRLHALDALIGLTPGAGRQELEQALQARVLATAELAGMYERWD